MHAKAEVYLDVLSRRLEALNRLAEGLRESQAAIVGMDLEQILHQVDYQESLCAEIHSYERQLEDLRLSGRSGASGQQAELNPLEHLVEHKGEDIGEAVRNLFSEIEKTRMDVRKLNRVQGELLRRSRRSVGVLINLTTHFLGGYNPQPALLASGAESDRK